MTDKKSDSSMLQLPGKLQISVDESVESGFYSNLQIVGSSETEFVVDFAYVPPQQRRAKVRSRIILSPKHAKSLLLLLSQRVKDHEERFGTISVRPPLKPGNGGGGQLPN